MFEFTILDHVFFFIIAVLLPGLSLLRGKVDMEEIEILNKGKFYFLNGSVLWIGAFFVGLLWLMAGREWTLLGISRPIVTPIVVGLTVLFMVAYLLEMWIEYQNESDNEEMLKAAPFLPSNFKELGQFTFLAFSAGVCEEVVYRGFLVNYLYGHFIDPVWAYNVAVVLPAIIFGIVHMYQGVKSVLKISVMSLLFGTIYIFSESLLIVVIIHFVVDMIGGFVGMMINKKMSRRDVLDQ